MTRRLALLLLLSASVAHAHGAAPAPAHGGIVAESSAENWVELAIKGRTISIWLRGQDGRSLPVTGLSAKATVLAGGKSEAVALVAGADSLTGDLPVPLSGKATVVLVISGNGRTEQVRFSNVQ